MNLQTSPSQKVDYSPPPVEGDFYRIADLLDDNERAILKRVRNFTARSQRTAILATYWSPIPGRSSRAR